LPDARWCADEKRRLMSPPQAWLRCLAPRSAPALRLVCIPHAGSGVSAYRVWARWLPAEVELIGVQLPGREDRRTDPPPPTLLDCALLIAEALATLDDRPYALLGHSFGALLGFETVRALETSGARPPRLFVASGARAPDCMPPAEQLHGLEEPALLGAIERYGGVPEAIRRAPDFFAAFAPVLRADFRLSETHVPAGEPRIATPLFAVGGLIDDYVPLARLLAWRARCDGPFTAKVYPGGHFYLHEAASGFPADLAEWLGRIAAATPTGAFN
jgi:surfactin synthase thioesterase subunit